MCCGKPIVHVDMNEENGSERRETWGKSKGKQKEPLPQASVIGRLRLAGATDAKAWVARTTAVRPDTRISSNQTQLEGNKKQPGKESVRLHGGFRLEVSQTGKNLGKVEVRPTGFSNERTIYSSLLVALKKNGRRRTVENLGRF